MKQEAHQYLCSPTGPGCARCWEAGQGWKTELSPNPLSSGGYSHQPACCQISGPGGSPDGCEGSPPRWGSEPAALQLESLRTVLWQGTSTGLFRSATVYTSLSMHLAHHSQPQPADNSQEASFLVWNDMDNYSSHKEIIFIIKHRRQVWWQDGHLVKFFLLTEPPTCSRHLVVWQNMH